MDELKEKRKYNAWTEEDLKEALKALQNKSIGLNESSKRFRVPKPTLKRHLEKRKTLET